MQVDSDWTELLTCLIMKHEHRDVFKHSWSMFVRDTEQKPLLPPQMANADQEISKEDDAVAEESGEVEVPKSTPKARGKGKAKAKAKQSKF